MRKGFVLLLLLVVFIIGAFYLLVPGTLSVKQSLRVGVNAKGFTRVFLQQGSGKPWLSKNEKNTADTNSFSYKGNTFTLVEKKLSSLVFAVTNERDSMRAELLIIPFQSDSVELDFIGAAATGLNPVHRVQKYFWVKDVAADLQTWLQKIQSVYADENNFYGFHIKKELVKDDNLISTFITVKSYPNTEIVYGLVDHLQTFAQKNGAAVTGAPMLNITANADSGYITRVALPVNKTLTSEENVQAKWMMRNGNILVTEVKGGPAQLKKVFAAMELYASDHQWTTAAIPFQSLVTDRRKEQDTSQWVTKVFWPVM